ncbi:hypothetical protein [Chitinimonas sp. BJB300]|uniref:hypothetical protein n=1 Tax=Chitinimonas sp. BJB300 TaxID=1559339 RepID=UPI000C0D16E6|nr:hypothetical protein [Chitinimonas sp. BJB300]PHV10402.1 hypothetical protein CSQ89_16420 [Chitinimonas sp. BJB300]TSJ83831.1 hypothetical protein FG002_020485 [Chitinimonas sp. BJB300]
MCPKWFVLTAFIAFSSSALAADPNEKQCAQMVEGVLQRMEIMAKQSTEVQKFQGLTAAEITAMRKAKGDCATQQELLKRVVVN